jgi:hypothetical protein
MWAEVTVEVKRDLPESIETLQQAFRDRIGEPTDKREAIDKTSVWQGDYEDENHMVYTHHNKDRVILVYRPERSTLKVHVESGKHRTGLGPIWRLIEEMAQYLKRLLKTVDNKMTKLQYIIYDGWGEIEDGRELGFLDKFKRSAKDYLRPGIYVPIATYLASVILGSHQLQALRNALIAILATLLWIVFDALVLQPRPSYERNLRR